MAGCSALGKARIEVGILVKIGWLGSPKMSVPGIAPNGKPRPWLDRVWPGKSKNAIFGQKTLVFGLFLAISYYLGVPPGGASTVFFYLSGPCTEEGAQAL